MHTSLQAALQRESRSDVPPRATGRKLAETQAFVDDRRAAVAQRELADVMNASPRVQQQRALNDAIQNHPRIIAQRKKADSLFSEIAQVQEDPAIPAQLSPESRKESANHTGLPEQLKSRIEVLSSMSMDHVKVHYNSEKPAQLQAHAYAESNEIHLAPGQERHLPHEAWHVVQQAQGRVQPTMQIKATALVNNEAGLEAEADVMRAKAFALQGKALQFARNRDLYAAPGRATHVPHKTWQLAEQDREHAVPTAPYFRRQSKPTGRGVAQCYKILGAGKYELEKENDSEQFFTTQSVAPSVKKPRAADYKIAHEISRTDAKQGLLIADDGSLAINNTSAHTKEFYATDDVFDAAQDKLERVKSAVRLAKEGSLRLTANRKMLSKVVPEAAKTEGDNNQKEFASLVSHICIEMASGVMGNANAYSHEAVFKKTGGESETVVNIASGADKGDSSIERLAMALADSPKKLDPKVIRGHMLAGRQEELPGRRYGIQAGHGQLDRKAQQLGVNRYANPEVGEGYATFSLAGSNDKQIDYLKTGNEREILKNIWGYHFAAVVAKSLDGKDTITIENYNRADDVYAQLKQIIDRLIKGNTRKFENIVHQVTPDKDDTRFTTQQKLLTALQVARASSEEKAHADFNNILNSYKATESWFFSMQGSGIGQSFHEKQAQSDDFLNPLTLRVRPRDKRREEARQQYIAQIVRHPAPPSRLAEQPAFSRYANEKSAIMSAIANAENEADIENAFNSGKNRLAAFTVTQALMVIESCTMQSGVGGFDNKTKLVAQKKTITGRLASAIELGKKAPWAIEVEIQKLWVTETEKHMKLAMNQAITYDAVEYLGSTLAYYNHK